MRKIILLLILCLPILANAQTDEKYLTGAIKLEDNRVTFAKEIQANGLSKEELYETMLSWANKRFQPDGKMNARVLFSDPEEGSIAVGGEEWLVFTTSALSLDRSRIYYQLLVNCEAGKVNAKISRIRYWYDEARNGGEKYNAEEWITDDMALNKAKTKLTPITGKFRRKTIDLQEELMTAIQTEIGNRLLSVGIIPNAAVVATQPIPSLVAPTKAYTLEDKVKTATRITLAASGEQFELEAAYWGGFDELFGKKVASFLLDQSKKMGNMLLEQSDTYTISFYQAGSNAPCAVVECKKLMSQPLTGEEAKAKNELRDNMKSYNMYIGEIVEITENP